MKILVLTSRYTATRDIIGEDFGRQTRLFSALKRLGYEIDFFVADYRKYEDKNIKLHGIGVSIRPFGIFHFLSFLRNLNNALKSNRNKGFINKKYDFLIATSDPLWGFIGYIFSKKHKIKFIYDLHDNYETYATYKIPFFRYVDNFVIKRADLVTTVSYTLKDKIKTIRENKVYVIQNGLDDKLFKPLDRMRSRKFLKLPKNKRIVAYAGSIQRAQGLHILISAFEKLEDKIDNLYLVLAGKFYKNEDKYINLSHECILYFGSLPQNKIALLINAADVVVVPNPDNNFTRYCFPYKIVEYMACNVPIVATNIGDVGKLLSTYKNSLCKPNDASDMADKIKIQLNKNRINYRKIAIDFTWSNISKKFDSILNKEK